MSNVSKKCGPLARDLGVLLSNGNLSDFKLFVEDKEYRVHRCILASRSSVFAAMFAISMQENLKKEVLIQDLDSETVSQVLKYMYTDKIDKLTTEQYLTLFSAADKYAIHDLRKKCCQCLRNHLPVTSVFSVLLKADLHHDEELLEIATQAFLENAVAIMRTPDWLPFLKNHTELASSVLMRLAVNYASSKGSTTDLLLGIGTPTYH